MAPATLLHPGLRQEGLPVCLHIYDVSKDLPIQLLNTLLANTSAPAKIGGIFHAGIEVNGREWTFGACREGSGVKSQTPRTDPQHHYRESVRLPNTRLSQDDVDKIIRELYTEYMGYSYSLFNRNCCHFAEDLCQRLGVGPLPAWVHRLGRVADSMGSVSQTFAGAIGMLCPRSEAGQSTPWDQCTGVKISDQRDKVGDDGGTLYLETASRDDVVCADGRTNVHV